MLSLVQANRSWPVMRKSGKQTWKWQNWGKHCTDRHCSQTPDSIRKWWYLSYGAEQIHPGVFDMWRAGFSVMTIYLHLLGGLIYQLQNVKICVRSVLKQIRLCKKPRWKRTCRVKRTILLRSDKSKIENLVFTE